MTIIFSQYTDFRSRSRIDFYIILFTCIPCAYVLSKRELLDVESGFVLISTMTQQRTKYSGLLLES